MRIIIWITMILGGSVLGYYLDSLLFTNIHSNYIFHIISFCIAVCILFLMVNISKNTGRILAKFGRKGKLKRMQTNVLVTQGPYKYMRHPMHLGLFLFPVGVAFLVGSPSFILIIAPVEIIFMLLMIKLVEEPEAIKKFGDEYINYMQQKPWFCFKINCLKELLKPISKNNVEE
ncbi:MAG: isoprenylcysteine carboxylmethyltransferase family protein [Bacteroidota bacterium]|nr:isoprenylcysteine carboxylmethyltransferase family protein [Bacteroidota bacterium]